MTASVIELVQCGIIVEVHFILYLDDPSIKEIYYFQLINMGSGEVFFYSPVRGIRKTFSFSSPFPHEDVQDHVVIFAVFRMLVRFPVRSVDMQFHIAYVRFIVDLNSGLLEIGPRAEVPIPGKEDFQALAVRGIQSVALEHLVVPDTADDLFRNF